MAQSKTERLIELIGLLLKHRYPVSKARIRSSIPQYAALGDDSFDRTFERDKKELRGLGVPLKVYTIAGREEVTSPAAAATLDADEVGYAVDRAEYYLPQLDFSAEEWTAIALVGAGGAAVNEVALDSLMHKIACQRPAGAAAPAAQPELGVAGSQRAEAKLEQQNLALLERAVQENVRVEFDYHTIRRDSTERRQADPYVLVYNGGVWYLVGHCHLRHDIRVFKLSRISKLKLLTKLPPFTIPGNFRKEDYLGRKAWEFPAGPPQEVRIQAAAEHAWLVKRELGTGARWDRQGTTAVLNVSNMAPFISWAAANCDRARIIAPREAADKVAQRLQWTKSLYK